MTRRKYTFNDPRLACGVDILPSLSGQCIVDPHKMINHAILEASTIKKNANTLDIGNKDDPDHIKIIIDRPDTNRIKVVYGSEDPTIPTDCSITPKQLIERVETEIGEFETIMNNNAVSVKNAVIKKMIITESIPRGIPDNNILSTADYIHLQYEPIGNHRRMFEEHGIKLFNPFHHAILELREKHGFDIKRRNMSHLFRSTEKVTWLGGFNGSKLLGYQEIGNPVVEYVQRMNSRPFWWKDFATPTELTLDGQEIILHRLEKADQWTWI
jgi:hypothetical protein